MRKILVLLFYLFYLSCATMGLKVIVRSNPAGAEIYCNGEYLGREPQVIKKKTSEDQRIEAVLGEYKGVKILKPGVIQWYTEALDRTKEAVKAIAGKEGYDYNEVIVDLNGSIEIQAFKVEREKEKKGSEEILAILNKLKNPSYNIIIYDASGTMQFPLSESDRTPRYVKAKEEIIKFIESASANNYYGLIIFGHKIPSGQPGTPQRKKSCSGENIELVVPLEKLNIEAFKNYIDKLQLKDHIGDTPLEDSIRKAADILKEKEGEKSIIVVTDGYDECDGRPDLGAKYASKFGIRTNILAYGVGVNSKGVLDEKKAIEIFDILREASVAGGGLFLSAKTAEELYEGMIKIELARFTYRIFEELGNQILTGEIGKKNFVNSGTYRIEFNTDKPFSEEVNILPGKNLKIFIGLAPSGEPELRKVYD